MSLVFSSPSDKSGIAELIDATVKTSPLTYSLAEKARDVNLALSRALSIIFQADGTWQFDDSNQEKLPIISTDLISGQRDYSFRTDQDGNEILDFFKVLVADQQKTFHELRLRDQQSDHRARGFTDGLDQTGTPRDYDMTGNSIFLDPVPDYSMRLEEEGLAGIKVYINRESTYFTATDTTKKPGIAGIFHEYLALHPAMKYATRGNMPVAKALRADVAEMEERMTEYYGSRERAGRKRLTMRGINYR